MTFSFVVAPASVCRWSPSSLQSKFINYLRYAPIVGATKCRAPMGTEWDIAPIMGGVWDRPLPVGSRGRACGQGVPLKLKAFSTGMSKRSGNFTLSGNSGYSENHVHNSSSLTVSGESLTPKLRERCSLSVPPPERQINTGTPFLLKNIYRNGVPALLHVDNTLSFCCICF